MGKQFFVFIVVLRALSAMIITNAHYTHVYPMEIFANGGLLGDVLFFSISGFCLAHINTSFGSWFKRRSIRVYTPTLIATIIFVMIGAYPVPSVWDGLKIFIWPTNYHFVGSIILLYIPFYFICSKVELTTSYFIKTSLVLFMIQSFLYLVVYDRSFYHIDNVREPMIEFLFIQSMLLGAYYRKVTEGESLKNSIVVISGGGLLMISYFISKVAFSKIASISEWQILNQVILFFLLWFIFRIFYSMETSLKKMPVFFEKLFKYLADRTLEIYLVQYVIIPKTDSLVQWPFNWFIVTGTILVTAHVLHWMSQKLLMKIGF